MEINIVGIGPGSSEYMTPMAKKTIMNSDVIVGYTVYVELVKDLTVDKKVLSTPMKKEVERCKLALEEALSGKKVSFVCSGDAGVYGMAGIMFEVAKDHKDVKINIIPGITAACSGASLLGAPLMHDFCVISLSDLLTPWEKIEKRLEMAAMADFCICLYNPRSKKRADYLKKACEIISRHQPLDLVCGYVKNVGRDGEYSKTCSLKELSLNEDVDMFTTVFIGNSTTKLINSKIVTPRGYKNV